MKMFGNVQCAESIVKMLEKKVLIVDDCDVYNELLSMYLKTQGYETEQHLTYNSVDNINTTDYLAYFFDMNCQYRGTFDKGGLRFIHENGFYYPVHKRILMSGDILQWQDTGIDGYYFDKTGSFKHALDIVEHIEKTNPYEIDNKLN